MKKCEGCGAVLTDERHRYCSRGCANRYRRIAERERHPEYTVWSCGGGIDSTALAVLFCEGKIPKPDLAVMVDTGYEKRRVMEYVRGVIRPRLSEIGVRLEIIRTKDHYPKQAIIDASGFCVIPAFQKNETTGKGNRLSTCCNETWKVQTIRKWLQSRGINRYVSLIGINADEARRQRRATRAYYTNRYPLIEMGIGREECVRMIERVGWPEPRRSSCIMCGLQSDGEFWDMKYNAPDDFRRLTEIERELRRTRPDIFIHRTCRPIDVVFR